VDEVAWAKNRTKSRVRAKVEHVFQVMKLKFGFVKVRYRGLKKNAQRLFVTCALVNLFVSRKKLLPAAGQTCTLGLHRAERGGSRRGS
jgi:transposase, IS5 family